MVVICIYPKVGTSEKIDRKSSPLKGFSNDFLLITKLILKLPYFAP